MKKTIIILMLLVFGSQVSFAKSPSMGIIIAVAGAIVALDGFSQVTVTKDVTYQDFSLVPDVEADFTYRTWVYNVTDGYTVSDIYHANPYPDTFLVYEWSYSDIFPSGGKVYAGTAYIKHYIVNKQVSVEKTMAVNVPTTKNVPQGIIGIAILSVGINQIIDYFRESSKIAWMPKINVLASGNDYQVQAVTTITF